jgi:hypothetical protein
MPPQDQILKEERRMTPFAQRIRQGFEEVKIRAGDTRPEDHAPTEAALYGRSWEEIAQIGRNTFNRVELDAVYGAVVRSYQRGPRSIWAPVLLEMLAPAIMRRLASISVEASEAQAEDVEQQLVAMILRKALRLREPQEFRFIDGRTVLWSKERVLRWLRRARQRQCDSFESHLELVYEMSREDTAELDDLCGGRIDRQDVRLVYRFYVWREPLATLAREHGIAETAMFSRIWRARQRLRQELGGTSGVIRAAA